MSKKNYLIYTLIKKLDAKENNKFKKYINYYFSKPDPYIELLEKINKLNKKVLNENDFPEDILMKIITNKNFTKNKFKLKNALFSFLRLSFIDSTEDILDSSYDLKEYLNYCVFAQYQKYNFCYETIEKLSENIKDNDFKKEMYNLVLSQLLEIMIPVNGWEYSNKKIEQLNKKFNENINNNKDYVNSKYFKRLLLLKLNLKDVEGIDTIFNNLTDIKSNTNFKLAEIESLNGITNYYTFKKNRTKVLENRKEVIYETSQIQNPSDYILASYLANTFEIVVLQLETISQNEYFTYLLNYIIAKRKLNNDFNAKQATWIALILKSKYFAIFISNRKRLINYLEILNEIKLNKFNEIHWFRFIMLKTCCIFKSNQFELAHTESSKFEQQINNGNKQIVLIRILSGFLLFEDPLITSEYRKIKRIISNNDLNNKDALKKLIKILYSYKTNKLKKIDKLKKDIELFEYNFTQELDRIEKVLINHFVKQI